MKFNCSLVFILATLFLKLGNSFQVPASSSLDLNHDGGIEEEFKLNKIRQERQQNILNQFLTSIQGILGPRSTTESTILDDILPPSQAPNESKRPGTTNNGNFVNQVVAAASGISSGLFGVLGVNTGPNPVPFLNYRTSPRPTSGGIGSNNSPSTNDQLGELLTGAGENKTNGQGENIFSSLHFPSPVPILGIVGELFGQKPSGNGGASSSSTSVGLCNDIQRLLGQCI